MSHVRDELDPGPPDTLRGMNRALLLLPLSVLLACGSDAAGDTESSGDDTGSSSETSSGPSTVGSTVTTTTTTTTTADESSSSTGTAESTAGSGDSSGTGGEPVCGDGVVEGGEACDDRGASEVCSADCAWNPGVVRWSAELPGMFARDCAVAEEVLHVGGSQDPALDPDGATIAIVRRLDAAGGELSEHLLHDGTSDGEVNRLALDEEGRVFAAGEFGSFTSVAIRGRIWAASAQELDALWAEEVEPTDAGMFSVADAVAVGDASVAVGSRGITVAAVDLLSLDGTSLWTAELPDWSIVAAVVLLEDGGLVVVGSGNLEGRATRLSPDGVPQWTLDPGALSDRPSALVLDGERLLIAGGEGAGWISELSLDGDAAWEKPAGPPRIEAMVLGDSGVLVVLAADETSGLQVRATDADPLSEEELRRGDETPVWTHVIAPAGEGPITGGLALGPEQQVYVCGTVGGDPASRVVSLSL